MSALLKSRIPILVAEAEVKAAAAVQKTGLDIEAGCKMRSRVDTGQMRDSWQWEPTGPLEGEVGNPVEHTLYNEFGTVSMAAQPMLFPAVEDARVPFERALAEVYR